MPSHHQGQGHTARMIDVHGKDFREKKRDKLEKIIEEINVDYIEFSKEEIIKLDKMNESHEEHYRETKQKTNSQEDKIIQEVKQKTKLMQQRLIEQLQKSQNEIAKRKKKTQR